MSKEEKTETVELSEIKDDIFEGWIDPEVELPPEKVVVLVALDDSLALGYVYDGEWFISSFPSESNYLNEDLPYCWLPLPRPFQNYELGTVYP